MNDTVYWLYFLECDGKKIYTGSTGNVAVRFEHHASGHGSKWTSNNHPTKVIAVKHYTSRSEAYSQERKLKKYSQAKKLNWIKSNCFYDLLSISQF